MIARDCMNAFMSDVARWELPSSTALLETRDNDIASLYLTIRGFVAWLSAFSEFQNFAAILCQLFLLSFVFATLLALLGFSFTICTVAETTRPLTSSIFF